MAGPPAPDAPGLTERGRQLVRGIAADVGTEVDLEDEHSRWALYEDVVGHAGLRDRLLQVVTEDEVLADPLVVRALAYVGDAEGRLWVDRLPADARAFAERRLREWALIRAVTEVPPPVAGELAGLTPWCQRLLVERSTSVVVLADLAELGASRKIRSAAREKQRGGLRRGSR